MNQMVKQPDLGRLGGLPVSVSVKVCECVMTVEQFVRWAPGTVLTFEKNANSPLSVHLGHREIGAGHAIQVGEKIGIQMDKIRN